MTGWTECTRPVDHTGRCRDDNGRSWNRPDSHPTTEHHAEALRIAARFAAERDAARAEVARLRHLIAALLAEIPEPVIEQLALEVES